MPLRNCMRDQFFIILRKIKRYRDPVVGFLHQGFAG
jgi:hypothetical protein